MLQMLMAICEGEILDSFMWNLIIQSPKMNLSMLEILMPREKIEELIVLWRDIKASILLRQR